MLWILLLCCTFVQYAHVRTVMYYLTSHSRPLIRLGFHRTRHGITDIMHEYDADRIIAETSTVCNSMCDSVFNYCGTTIARVQLEERGFIFSDMRQISDFSKFKKCCDAVRTVGI